MDEKTKSIAREIKESVEPLMEKWQEDMFRNIKNLEQFCKVDVYKIKPRPNTYEIHRLKRERGWAVSMERWFGRREIDLKEMIRKESNAKLEKIDIAVCKKLKGVDVEKIEKIDFTVTGKDAYCEGAWRINDDKVFSFHTIYAGGYNIQCLHIRTIYSYK